MGMRTIKMTQVSLFLKARKKPEDHGKGSKAKGFVELSYPPPKVSSAPELSWFTQWCTLKFIKSSGTPSDSK